MKEILKVIVFLMALLVTGYFLVSSIYELGKRNGRDEVKFRYSFHGDTILISVHNTLENDYAVYNHRLKVKQIEGGQDISCTVLMDTLKIELVK